MLNNKTIILLNLAEYRLILADLVVIAETVASNRTCVSETVFVDAVIMYSIPHVLEEEGGHRVIVLAVVESDFPLAHFDNLN